MRIYGKLALVFLITSLATLGSDYSIWACNAAITLAILETSTHI